MATYIRQNFDAVEHEHHLADSLLNYRSHLSCVEGMEATRVHGSHRLEMFAIADIRLPDHLIHFVDDLHALLCLFDELLKGNTAVAVGGLSGALDVQLSQKLSPFNLPCALLTLPDLLLPFERLLFLLPRSSLNFTCDFIILRDFRLLLQLTKQLHSDRVHSVAVEDSVAQGTSLLMDSLRCTVVAKIVLTSDQQTGFNETLFA